MPAATGDIVAEAPLLGCSIRRPEGAVRADIVSSPSVQRSTSPVEYAMNIALDIRS